MGHEALREYWPPILADVAAQLSVRTGHPAPRTLSEAKPVTGPSSPYPSSPERP